MLVLLGLLGLAPLITSESLCLSGTSTGPCINMRPRPEGLCADYICRGYLDVEAKKCPQQNRTNMCPCHTRYADGSKYDGKVACCGEDCPKSQGPLTSGMPALVPLSFARVNAGGEDEMEDKQSMNITFNYMPPRLGVIDAVLSFVKRIVSFTPKEQPDDVIIFPKNCHIFGTRTNCTDMDWNAYCGGHSHDERANWNDGTGCSCREGYAYDPFWIYGKADHACNKIAQLA